MNLIWLLIIIFCLFYAFITGNIDLFVKEIFLVPNKTLNLLITVGSLIIIYNGIFKIAIKAGIIELIGKKLKFISVFLFPKIPSNHIIHSYICSNITANLLGLGIATTPITLKTIREMKLLNNDSEVASKEMITLLVLNITSFSFFPLTIITLRNQYNSKLGIIIWTSLVCITLFITITSLFIDRLFQRIIKWDI